MAWVQSMNESMQRLFEERLAAALSVALTGQTALVIVPASYSKRSLLSYLVHAVPPSHVHLIRMPGNELHFDGTRGSVRIYDAEHPLYDKALKHLRGYPYDIPTFLHPEVEGL